MLKNALRPAIGLGAGCLVWFFLWFELERLPNFFWPVADGYGFLMFCLAAPVIEEFFFRDMLYNWIQTVRSYDIRIRGVLIFTFANLATTAAFSVVHMLTRDIVTGLLVIVPSLYLGFIRQRARNVGPCILVHAFWNYGWFAFFSL